MVVLPLLAGCIWSTGAYQDRLKVVTDDDGDGWSEAQGDCDDDDPEVAPEVVERCDNRDQDCDGSVDEGAPDASTWYVDVDGDGHGGTATLTSCSRPDGYVDQDGDCDDTDPSVHPGAEDEAYDGVDRDCDGADPDDLDGDGHPGGPTGTDCNDADAGVYPGAEETWEDGITDNDCDGEREATQGTFGAEVWNGSGEGAEFGRRVAVAPTETGSVVVAAAPYDSIAHSNGGAVYVFGGAESGAVGDPRFVAEGVAWFLGFDTRSFADGDGDGLPEFLLSAAGAGGGFGTAWLVEAEPYGPPLLPGDVASLIIEGDQAEGYLGGGFRWVGDVTGDGVDELAVAASLADTDVVDGGVVLLLSGGRTGTLSPPDADTLIVGVSPGDAIYNPMAAGDQDGDGVNDLFVAAASSLSGTVLSGNSDFRLWDDALFSLTSDDPAVRRDALMVGDVDGDSRPDLAALERNQDAHFYTLLSATRLRTELDATAIVHLGDGSAIFDIMDLGDLDGDGRSETLVPAQYSAGMRTSVVGIVFGASLGFGASVQFDGLELLSLTARPNAAFGYRVTKGFGVVEDGVTSLVVSGYGDDQRGWDAGAVALLELPH